jgi:hypothetical protein
MQPFPVAFKLESLIYGAGVHLRMHPYSERSVAPILGNQL